MLGAHMRAARGSAVVVTKTSDVAVLVSSSFICCRGFMFAVVCVDTMLEEEIENGSQ